MSIIICGSRQYTRSLDEIVDSFDTIVRHNMLVSNCGYGKKYSTIQVMNAHVHKNYKRKLSLKQWMEHYAVKKPDNNHIRKFYEYINSNTSTSYVTYHFNNTALMKKVCNKHSIPFNGRQLKCGLGHVAKCIHSGVKPFLIGYSISETTIADHQYNNHTKLFRDHDHLGETNLIKKLHKKGLIDASLCLLTDDGFSDEIIMTYAVKSLLEEYL